MTIITRMLLTIYWKNGHWVSHWAINQSNQSTELFFSAQLASKNLQIPQGFGWVHQRRVRVWTEMGIGLPKLARYPTKRDGYTAILPSIYTYINIYSMYIRSKYIAKLPVVKLCWFVSSHAHMFAKSVDLQSKFPACTDSFTCEVYTARLLPTPQIQGLVKWPNLMVKPCISTISSTIGATLSTMVTSSSQP